MFYNKSKLWTPCILKCLLISLFVSHMPASTVDSAGHTDTSVHPTPQTVAQFATQVSAEPSLLTMGRGFGVIIQSEDFQTLLRDHSDGIKRVLSDYVKNYFETEPTFQTQTLSLIPREGSLTDCIFYTHDVKYYMPKRLFKPRVLRTLTVREMVDVLVTTHRNQTIPSGLELQRRYKATLHSDSYRGFPYLWLMHNLLIAHSGLNYDLSCYGKLHNPYWSFMLEKHIGLDHYVIENLYYLFKILFPEGFGIYYER